jgi:hypothetical protein
MINPFKDVDWNRVGQWPVGTAVLIGSIGAGAGVFFWLLPGLARPFYVVWYAAACSVGLVISNVLLAALYYGLFTSTGWIMRLAGRRPLNTTPDRAAATYWLEAGPSPKPERYFRQF